MPAPIALLQARRLAYTHPGQSAPLFADLSFDLTPGLSLIRGGDGRGKTSLLRLIAGELAPGAGQILRSADTASCSFEQPADPVHDPVLARAWLAERRAGRFAATWLPALELGLIEGLGLSPHMDKPMFMLSTGSRRKLGLVAAAASGAALTLLDTPYAALDARSGRLLSELLAEAADSAQRAWVIADYALPAGLGGVALAALIELGD
ncbi:ABC transporter ATP-binding protein [Roseateles cavernae]|uniref:ABC transporter ATP-binding protein n=1 Tax=Roseateles cavernae TaxID=3153578 RepID=UPI0032E383B7